MIAADCYAQHEAIKLDPERWSKLTYVGEQRMPADKYGPAEVLELRNCTCGSTLARLITLPLAEKDGYTRGEMDVLFGALMVQHS